MRLGKHMTWHMWSREPYNKGEHKVYMGSI